MMIEKGDITFFNQDILTAMNEVFAQFESYISYFSDNIDLPDEYYDYQDYYPDYPNYYEDTYNNQSYHDYYYRNQGYYNDYPDSPSYHESFYAELRTKRIALFWSLNNIIMLAWKSEQFEKSLYLSEKRQGEYCYDDYLISDK